MNIRSALASVAVVAVLLVGTAAVQSSDRSARNSTAPAFEAVPRPSVVSSASSEPTAPPCENRLESLRPQGPLPEPGGMPPGSTMERIAEQGRLTVAVGLDTYLISSRDPETRQLEGFEIDIAGDIAEAIFGDRSRVDYRQLDLPGRLAAVEKGDVDLMVGSTTITCQRRNQVAFSTVYYQAGQRVLVNRGSGITGLDGLAYKRVCASRGSTSLQTVLRDPSGPVPVGVPSTTDCLVMLQLGRVAAVSSDDALLAGLAAQDPRTKIVGPPLNPEPYGIAINRDAPDLVRFVNAVLERRVEDGRWQASYQRWLAEALDTPPSPPEPQYRD